MLSKIVLPCSIAYTIVAKSFAQAKTIGMSLLECEFVDVRCKRRIEIDASNLDIGEIQDMFWALKQGLYGWIEDRCPSCGISNRIYYDCNFYCSNCEEKFHNKEGGKD